MCCGLLEELHFIELLVIFFHVHLQIIIAGFPESDDTKAMLRAVHSHFIPNKILMVVDGTNEGFLYEKVELLKPLQMLDGKATAYVCENFACAAPTNSLEQFEQLLGSC